MLIDQSDDLLSGSLVRDCSLVRIQFVTAPKGCVNPLVSAIMIQCRVGFSDYLKDTQISLSMPSSRTTLVTQGYMLE